jgi:hypothetical protein
LESDVGLCEPPPWKFDAIFWRIFYIDYACAVLSARTFSNTYFSYLFCGWRPLYSYSLLKHIKVL